MKSFFLLLATTILLTASCRDNADLSPNRACGVRDPLDNLPWLKAQMDDFRQKKQEGVVTVTAYEYKGQQYIVVTPLYLSCYFCVVHTCDGTRFDPGTMTTAQRELVEAISREGKSTRLWPRS
ncbi:hypothetical protein [Tellurirhabdus rosea]|uniref:hypothetical protein n=1 Tax=Tellurirhabdus rosea TaxID=2674997 RepID=UPI00224FEC99|nr:hypothetical protein [Tellurirhabdus rosea]